MRAAKRIRSGSAGSTATSKPGGRPPPASLQVSAGVVGDDERRPAVDDGDDRCACGRGGHDARQLELDLLVVDGLVDLAEDDFGLDVDPEDAVDRPNEGDHAAGAAVSSSTRAAVVAAWRAAETGRWPAARAQA